MEILISNPKNLENIKSKIKNDDHKNLFVVSDFDQTLTYGTINGIKIPSIVSELRNGKYLTEDYVIKTNELFEKYYKIAKDPSISLVDKKKAILEWWTIHYDLLFKLKLNKSDLKDIVLNTDIKFRKGVINFLDFLYKHNIPLIIISASTCGDLIQMFFEKYKKDYPNIFYIVNKLNWDKNNIAISNKNQIVHPINKDEIIIKDIPEIYKIIKDKTNIVLLGDIIDDIDMAENFKYETLLKIGFLNLDYNTNEDEYKKHFDVVLKGDGDFDYVNDLFQDLI